MKLGFLIKKECIIAKHTFQQTAKNSVMNEIVSLLYKNSDIASEGYSEEQLLQRFLDREKEQSTGIGDGIALPHIRINGINRYYSMLITTAQPIAFDSLDNQPATIFYVNVVNRENPNILLKSRALILNFLSSKTTRENVLSCPTDTAIWDLLNNSKLSTEFDILASDIMRHATKTLSPEMTLREAAGELHRSHVDALPVVDEQQKFIGELSGHDLFAFGLPAFFFSLNQVSFVKHMNPFEKYFKIDQKMKVGDLMATKKSLPLIGKDATIMEVIFEMAVKNKEMLYVVDHDNIFSGILDRYTIIDKIYVAKI